jgi:hypothetical protein
MRITSEVKGQRDFKEVIGNKLDNSSQASKIANIRAAMLFAKNVAAGTESRFDIKPKAFYKYRVTKFFRRDSGEARIIFRHNPIKLRHLLGEFRQNFDSAGVGRHLIPKAFIAKMPNGDISVFKRHGISVRKSPKGWWLNLPIKEQTIKIYIDDIVNYEARQIQGHFKKFYQIELKNQLKK